MRESTSPSIYIETTIPSVLTARPPRSTIALAHQETTTKWWATQLPKCTPFISTLVLEEMQRGHPEAAKRRIEAVSGMEILDITPEVRRLANFYLRELPVPLTAEADMHHLAAAALNGIRYIVTWNCKHLANGYVMEALGIINRDLMLHTPVICTPEELVYGRQP